MKFIFRFLLVCISIIIIALIIIFHTLNKIGDDAEKHVAADGINYTNKLPPDYSQLVKQYSGTSFEGSIYSKTRDPLAGFTYKGKFTLLLYKLPVKTSMPLDLLVREEFTGENLMGNSPYWVFSANHWMHDNSPYIVEYKQGIPEKANGIFLRLLGSNTKNICKNDTVAIYVSELSSFSIRYSQKGSIDFYGALKDNVTTPRPFQIEFRKYNNQVYLIIRSPK
jgi:hypothetical protein